MSMLGNQCCDFEDYILQDILADEAIARHEVLAEFKKRRAGVPAALEKILAENVNVVSCSQVVESKVK